jgi:NitT/TauT family transport system substrate-binding protein
MIKRVLAMLGLACLVASPADAAGTPVRVGVTNSASDVSLFIAHKRGYFAAEGLDVSFSTFNSAAQMIAPFAAGDIDIGTGATSAAFYNAVARGIDLRIVADKNSTPPGRGTQPLLVRKDHVDSGRYKSLADLKGFRIAVSAPGTSSMTTVTRALEKGGLSYSDVDLVALAFPQHVIALTNKAVDAAFTVEPSASKAVGAGAAVRIMGDDEVYPYHQLSVMQATGRFATEKPAALKGFLKALMHGVRDFNEALVDGRYAGPKGDAVAQILAEYGPFKDPAIYKSYNVSYSDPDGKVNMESLRYDLDFFKQAGLINGDVTIEKALDLSFLNAAIKEIGPYRAP